MSNLARRGSSLSLFFRAQSLRHSPALAQVRPSSECSQVKGLTTASLRALSSVAFRCLACAAFSCCDSASAAAPRQTSPSESQSSSTNLASLAATGSSKIAERSKVELFESRKTQPSLPSASNTNGNHARREVGMISDNKLCTGILGHSGRLVAATESARTPDGTERWISSGTKG